MVFLGTSESWKDEGKFAIGWDTTFQRCILLMERLAVVLRWHWTRAGHVKYCFFLLGNYGIRKLT